MTLAWYLYFGMHLFSMTREQVLACRLGEFYDMMAVHGIVNGVFKEVRKKRQMSFDEALALK